jgi:hypothetical protein
MFQRLVEFFQKLFRIGQAAQDVSTTAGDLGDLAKQRNVGDIARGVVQTASDANSATGSVQDATK